MIRALRDYQTAAIVSLREQFAAGHKRVILVAPTGSGKSDIIGHLTALAVAKGSKVMAIAHRRELIGQLADRLRLHGIENQGIIMAGEEPNDAPVQVCSIQTLVRRKFPEAQLCLVDEVHHAIKGSAYERVMDAYPGCAFVGATATPARMDGRGLGDIWNAMVVAATPKQLCDAGYLAPFKGKAFRKPEGLDQVKTVAGDYDIGGLAEIYEKPKILGDIVQMWQTHAAGRRTIAFLPSIKASLDLVERMRAIGVAAEHLDYKASKPDRKAIMDRVRSGETLFLSNVALVSEGVDLPELEVVLIARATKSLALYLQMCGRASRPSPGKACAYLLDHGDCVARFGHPYAPRAWTLDTTKPKKPSVGELKTCPSCFAILEGQPAICPECGAVLRKPGKPIETDNNVIAVDIDAPQAPVGTKEDFERILRRHRAQGHKPGWAVGEYTKRFPGSPLPWSVWRMYVGRGKGARWLEPE
jgi:DNA repair protein RadD